MEREIEREEIETWLVSRITHARKKDLLKKLQRKQKKLKNILNNYRTPHLIVVLAEFKSRRNQKMRKIGSHQR